LKKKTGNREFEIIFIKFWFINFEYEGNLKEL
jgi:hypothetical protein